MVIWDPRCFNAVADHAANAAMDLGRAWKVTDDEALVEARARKANCRILFDGAMRGDGTGAGGMAVIAYYPGGRREILCRAGVLFGNISSSFLAEALALEWCLVEFTVLLHRLRHDRERAAGRSR